MNQALYNSGGGVKDPYGNLKTTQATPTQPMLDPTKYNAGGGVIDPYGTKTAIPTAPKAPIQTTTQQRAQTESNSSALDKTLMNLDAKNKAKAAAAATAATNTTTDTQNQGNKGQGEATDTQETPAEPEDSFTQYLREERDRALTEGKQREQQIVATLDSLSGQFNSATDSLIESIKTTFAGRIKAMEFTNKKSLATARRVGIRTGRERYAAITQDSIMNDEENQGIARISELEGQMLTLIAEAERARATGNMKAFNDKYTMLEKVYDDTQSTLKDLHKTVTDNENNRINRLKEERAAKKEEFTQMLDLSERSAPAIASKLATFKTDAEKADFLEAYSKASGIDIDVLLGDIKGTMADDMKAQMDIENTKNTIANRNRSTNISQGHLNLAASKYSEDKLQDKKKRVLRSNIIEEFKDLNKEIKNLPAGITQRVVSKEEKVNAAKSAWATAGFAMKEFDEEFKQYLSTEEY